MMTLTLKAKTQNFTGAMDLARREIGEARMKAAMAGALVLQREAQHRCPELTGTMNASATVTPQAASGEKTVGFYTEYAARMHEDSKYRIGEKSKLKQAHYGVTVGMKFIERAAAEAAKLIQDAVNTVFLHAISAIRGRK